MKRTIRKCLLSCWLLKKNINFVLSVVATYIQSCTYQYVNENEEDFVFMRLLLS